MKKYPVTALLASALFLSSFARAEEAPPPFRLQPTKLASWWTLGEEVTFRVLGREIPADVSAIEGVVSDISGNQIAKVQVKASDLPSKGWQWKPKDPGFYEVEFFSVTKDDRVPLTTSFTAKAPNGKEKTFERKRQGFAVVAPQTAPESAVGQFGFTSDGGDPAELPLANRVGFDLVRLLCNWGASFTNLNAGIESTKGELNWALFDSKVDLFANAGFVINAQINYTPLWASPHPEKTKVNICVVEGTAYAPVDMGDFSRFVEASVARYKDRIHLWEIGNEPSVPGGSVFWEDTAENYVKMLKAGHDAVKKVQPEAEVWIGGLGQRSPYHVFYNQILKLGAGDDFDVLSLHGSFCAAENKFRAIEVANGVAPKPVVSGEWHGIIQGNMQTTPILAEKALSLKMMKDLLYQLKQGVSRLLIFEMLNQTEKETLGFAKENGWFTHASGLFRRKPQTEPRHPAVVLANFLDATGRKASFVKEFQIAEGLVAAQFATNRGPLVVLLSEGDGLTAACLAPFLTKASELHDWEGKSIPLGKASELEKGKIYYLTAVKNDAVAKAPEADQLLSPWVTKRTEGAAEKGTLISGKLFESVDQPATVADWIADGWKLTKLNEQDHDERFSARAAAGVSEAGLDVVVEVQDSAHVQNEAAQWWNADSVQIAVDCEGDGLPGGSTEVIAALTPAGPVLGKILAASLMGDIPAQWSAAGGAVKYGQVGIVREGITTRYQIRIPWTELYPLAYDPHMKLHMALAVNNSSGNGRTEFLEWGAGITGDKDPSSYGSLEPRN